MDSITLTFHSDNKGYFDRECPNEECLFRFKVSMEDWKNKVSDECVYCPMCGYKASADKWFTSEQIEQMQNIAASYTLSRIQETLDDSFKSLERSTRRNKYVKIKYKPGTRISFVNNPIGQCEEWETEICCEKCNTHYSVIGSAFFCPCCGHNSAVSSFNDSLNSIEKMINSLSEMRDMLIDKYDLDSAESMCRKMLESSIGDMVSAFQEFACSKYEELSGNVVRVNDFQMVGKGSSYFEDETGKPYSYWLSSAELNFMKLMFQRRHLIEHCNGMVDQKYLDHTNDNNYTIGQRIVIKEQDAKGLLEVLRKLGAGLVKLGE